MEVRIIKKLELEEVVAKADLIYDFVQTGAENINSIHVCENGEVMSMVQMHTLTMVYDNPGLCVSDVAKMWGHTLGAASRNIDRLQKKGYIEKRKLEGNNKEVRLYATESGKELAAKHKENDKKTIERMFTKGLEKHSAEEIDSFFKVLETLGKLIKEEKL